MKRRKAAALAILALLFFFAPVQRALIQGPCAGCLIPVTFSLSCDLLPVGLYLWQDGPGIGCLGPAVP